MTQIEPVPDGSIYFWCYRQGLRGVAYSDLVLECQLNYKELRDKDIQNFWNGYYRREQTQLSVNTVIPQHIGVRETLNYDDLPLSPYKDMPENMSRFVPCNADNRPMIKWGSGCMTLADAQALRHQVYLAENTRGTQQVIIDCDGDHDESNLDLETVAHLVPLISETHCLMKPKHGIDYDKNIPLVFADTPMSFHLTFYTDRTIPTMHFPAAHIDVIGNERNSLRYYKNKEWNGLAPQPMTPEIWSYIMEWVRYREENQHESARVRNAASRESKATDEIRAVSYYAKWR